jgi:primosomal protein N' (replication factor Y) (superfamily II helicase)
MNIALEVAVPGPFIGGLNYQCPPDLLKESDINIDIDTLSKKFCGTRVQVPLGKRLVVGVILKVKPVETLKRESGKKFELKTITQLLDTSPIYSDALFKLIGWISLYYHHPIGDTFQTALIGPLSEPKPLAETHTLSANLNISRGTDSLKLLTAEQAEVLRASLAKKDFHIQCLEGVTGSGKTEIYLQRIAPLLEQGQQILILVPEIGLTPQTIKRFEARFKHPIVTLHSGLNATERKTAIYHTKEGSAKIIIGTRSAVFIPTKDLGMIIIDEEHDLSFKQQNGLRYHARDVAIKRAQLENIPILLGSATPSLETLHNALSQKYLHLKLLNRPQESTLPKVHCINLKAQKNLIDGLSPPLIQAIKKHLNTPGPAQNKNQILLFINRRGFAPMLMCHECGWQAVCPRCDKPYTLHIHPTRLSCHHCEVQKNIFPHCPECKSETPLSDVGLGTEKLELALQTLFPDKKILRIDRTNTSGPN